jgi:SAM-dependent methyltransferase
MEPATVQFLLDLNYRFYTDFGSSFAATRRRIQPGVRRVLAGLPDSPGDCWLDLGCGSGALALEWLRAGRQSAYLGMDFSSTLLEEASKAVAALPNRQNVSFFPGSLAEPGWTARLGEIQHRPLAGMLCFAVLHHLPSCALRRQVMRQAAGLLPGGGLFVYSVWQFQHSPRLMDRRASWEQVGLDPAAVEPGDTLLDWRAVDADQSGQSVLRYVHLFDPDELADLAQSTGFEVLETFESDGQGGRLGLYQVWRKLPESIGDIPTRFVNSV